MVAEQPRKEPVSERRLKGPWSDRAGAWDDGCRSVTLETEPDPLKTVTPKCLLRANCTTDSTTSEPAEISRMTGFMAKSLSLVMTMGGLGLFLDPGGRPLGFFEISNDDEPISAPPPETMICFLCLDDEDPPPPPPTLPEKVGTLRGLFSESSSSEE